MSGSEDELTRSEILKALAPLASVAKVLARFGRDPFGFVATIISLYIVDSILNLGAFAVNSVLAAFGFVVGFFDSIRVTLVTTFGRVGIDLLEVYVAGQQTVADIVSRAGAAAPFLAVGFAAVALYVGYRVAVALLGELPVGSSIVDLLGLR